MDNSYNRSERVVCICVRVRYKYVYILCVRLLSLHLQRFVIIWQQAKIVRKFKAKPRRSTPYNTNASHNEPYGKRLSVVGLRLQTFVICTFVSVSTYETGHSEIRASK